MEVFAGAIRGAKVPLEAEVVRELTEEDLLVRSLAPVGAKPPGIKSLRALHHKLAQCLAQGMSEAEASIVTGYSSSRVSILKADPAFQELLEFYTKTRKDIFVDVQQRMAGLATTAVEILQEKLEDTPEAVSIKDLNNILKSAADRGGHAPVRKSEHKHVLLDAAELARLKQDVEENTYGKVRTINQAEESARCRAFVEREAIEDNSGTEVSNDNPRPVEREAEVESGSEERPSV